MNKTIPLIGEDSTNSGATGGVVSTKNNDNDSMRPDPESSPGLKQKEQKEGLREKAEVVNEDDGEIEGEEGEEEGDDNNDDGNDDDDNEDDEDEDVNDDGDTDDDVESDEGDDEDVPNDSDANDEESIALIVALGGMGKCLVALQRCSRDIQVRWSCGGGSCRNNNTPLTTHHP